MARRVRSACIMAVTMNRQCAPNCDVDGRQDRKKHARPSKQNRLQASHRWSVQRLIIERMIRLYRGRRPQKLSDDKPEARRNGGNTRIYCGSSTTDSYMNTECNSQAIVASHRIYEVFEGNIKSYRRVRREKRQGIGGSRSIARVNRTYVTVDCWSPQHSHIQAREMLKPGCRVVKNLNKAPWRSGNSKAKTRSFEALLRPPTSHAFVGQTLDKIGKIVLASVCAQANTNEDVGSTC
ncbi:hypothetical protein KCU74_g137, partial [Aureobasidium melanogenum]